MTQEYKPCRTGLHVCGANEEAGEFFTQANFPMAAAQARAAFDRARAEIGESDEDQGDFVVDLMIGGDTNEDFWIRRQMLDRLASIAQEATRG